MNEQPEALLADADIESILKANMTVMINYAGIKNDIEIHINDELRRLHEVNQELLEVLKAFSDYVRDEQNSTDGAVTYSTTAINHWAFLARAAIAKATGEQA